MVRLVQPKSIRPVLGLLLALILLPACNAPAPPPPPAKAVGDKSAVAAGAKAIAPVKAIDQLTSGQLVTGTLTATDRQFVDKTYFDIWPYAGTAGEQVTITLISDDFDTYLILRLLRGDTLEGAVDIGSDDDSAGDMNSTLTVTLPENGTYVVIANSVAPGAQGSYQLLAVSGSPSQARPQVDSSGLQPLAVNSVVNGSLASGDRQLADGVLADLYTFEASAGSLITTVVRSTEFDAMLYLGRIVNGEIITIASDDDSGGGLDSRAEWRVEESGTYIVAASSVAANTTGQYLVAVGITNPIDYASRYPTGGDPNGRYAVLVGIDDYPSTGSDLPSSVDDVMVFKQMLIEQLGFTEANIKTITDQEAYRDHILTAFERHLGQAGPNGSAVFYYSGHGTQLDENIGSDYEADGKDEAIYIWGNEFNGSVIVDEEIGALANRLATDRVLVVLDACHSGTGTRGAGGDFPIKEVNFADIKATTDLPLTVVTSKDAPPSADPNNANNDIVNGPAGHLLLSAASSSEYALASSEVWPEVGRKASVFTYYLYRAVTELGTGATWEQIMDDVRPKTSNYSAAKDNSQTVQLEGQAGTMTIAEFFGL